MTTTVNTIFDRNRTWSATQWRITKDHIAEPGATAGTNQNAAGLVSRMFSPEAPLPQKFKMYDDDGKLCYEGEAGAEADFQPLDDFGMPNAGCTRIDYLIEGKWVTC